MAVSLTTLEAPAEGRGTAPLVARLARRELRGGLKGFRVFIACLALGVAAIAGVGSASQALLEGLRADARAILGGDLDVRLVHREASADQRAWLGRNGTISHVTTFRAMARPEGAEGTALLVELKAVDDRYPLYGTLKTDPATDLVTTVSQRDGLWGALVEPALLTRLGIEVGDALRLGEARFEVRGTVRGEPDRGAQMFTLGPRMLVGQAGLAATGLVQPGSLTYQHYRVRLPEETDSDAWRAALSDAFPDAGWRVRGPEDAAPRVSRVIDRVTLFMGFVGLTALLVGGVGVGNAVSSYLAGRLRTVATLKCLGASGRLVLGVYGLQILVLALVAIAIGLALGAALPFVVVPFLAERLAYTVQASLQVGPLATAAVFGLLTAAAFSLAPLARAARVSAAPLFRSRIAPLDARIPRWARLAVAAAVASLAGLTLLVASDRELAAWFVLGAGATVLLLRGAAAALVALARREGRLRPPNLRLAVANLCRPGTLSSGLVVSLGLGLTLLVAIAVIEVNMSREIEETLPERAPTFFMVDIRPDQAEAFDALVRAQPGFEDLERVPMLRGRITAVNGTSPEALTVPANAAWVFQGDRGLTWSAAPPPETEITAGDWWPADYQGPPLVSLDGRIAEALGLGLGDTLTVNILGRPTEVAIANLRTIEWGRLGINFVMIFSPGVLEDAPQTNLATIEVDAAGADTLERAVAAQFPNISIVRVKDALDQVAETLDNVVTAVRAIAAVALAAGILVLTGVIAAGHHRRIYDAVVLKVLGATRWSVATTFLIEFGLLGVLTASLAAMLGTAAGYAVLTQLMGLGFELPLTTAVATALIALAITLAVGFAGTWRALGQPAMGLLRNE